MAKLIMVEDSKAPSLRLVPPLRAYEPWTDLEDQDLARRFSAGVCVSDLAIVHQRTRGSITAELKRLGLVAGNLQLKKRSTA